MRRGCLGDSPPPVAYLFTLLNILYNLTFPFDVTSLFVLSVLYTRFYRFFAAIDILLLLRLVHILCGSTICTKPARLAVPPLLGDL